MRYALLLATLALGGTACTTNPEFPSEVKDLRVLGIRMDPPELMAPSCAPLPELLDTYAAPVQLTALLATPRGIASPLRYELLACASRDDRTCKEPGQRVVLAEGELAAAPGSAALELVLQLQPGLASTEDGTPLLEYVRVEDPAQGLGGLLMPLVLHITAGQEEIYAQKLMVFSCRFFPESTPNTHPELPAPLLNGKPWEESEVPTISKLRLELRGLSERQKTYVVPAYDLSKVELRESWRISWFTTLGSFSPHSEGSVEDAASAEWFPPDDATAQEVTIWVVARDGRGGLTWLTRTLSYQP